MQKKSLRITALILFVVTLFTACVTTKTAGNSGKTPPGQAKKITGSKSAKPYAPGQRKKK